MDVASTDQHTVKPWFNGKLDFSPPANDFAKDGFPLVGGRLDYIDGRPVAALVYQHGNHVINVFMWPTTGTATSAERIETEHGYNVEQLMVAGMNCWVVSDLNQQELDKFAELIRAKGERGFFLAEEAANNSSFTGCAGGARLKECIGCRPSIEADLPMRRAETFFIAIAIAFYVWFLTHYGPGQVLGYVRMAGWGLALTISLETIARIANTIGWRVTIEDYPPKLKFLELFAARIGGEAIDYVTPSAQLGGQFVMAVDVREKLRMPVGLATVVVASLAEAIGQIAFLTIALVISLRLIPVAANLYWAIVGGFTLAVALAGGFFFVQMKRPFSHLWRAATKLDIARINTDEIRESADEADAVLLDFYARHRRRFVASCICYAVAWSLGPLEIYILLTLLHQPASLQIVLLVEAVGLLIERATFLIPAKLVSQEGGKALILGMLGYPPGVGFVVGFLRRIKEMVWVLFGLVALMIHRMVVQQRGDTTNAAAAGRDSVIKMQRAQGEQSL